MENLKISICIPQYNRISYLLKSLAIISNQQYNNIEVVISDDCSDDDTVAQIEHLKCNYRFPIIFSRNQKNEGYDRNYRKCIELATGDYAIVIGNDDSINEEYGIRFLAEFLQANNYPDIGFCNMIEERTGNTLIKRAYNTGVIGTGPDVALRFYSCFSFVGGLIYKRSEFLKYNTGKADGTVYAQMYLGCLMIAMGCSLFSIEEPLVLKDILVNDEFRKSYRDRVAKRWRDFKIVDGGMPSVIAVLLKSFDDAGSLSEKISYKIHQRIYSITYPFWIQDYKSNKALPEAIGLIVGMNPLRHSSFKNLNNFSKLKVYSIYCLASTASLLFPNFIFEKVKQSLYHYLKRNNAFIKK